jgi:hypothetical protein
MRRGDVRGCLLFHGDASPGVVRRGDAVLRGWPEVHRPTDVLCLNAAKAQL